MTQCYVVKHFTIDNNDRRLKILHRASSGHSNSSAFWHGS